MYDSEPCISAKMICITKNNSLIIKLLSIVLFLQYWNINFYIDITIINLENVIIVILTTSVVLVEKRSCITKVLSMFWTFVSALPPNSYVGT